MQSTFLALVLTMATLCGNMPSKQKPAGEAGRRIRHTVFVNAAIFERCRNAAACLAGSPEFLSLAALLDNALEREVTRLERKHNGGKPFALRPVALRGGRRPNTT